MIAFYGVSIWLIGLGMGWFGRRIYLRLEAWGIAMNQQDAILRDSTPEEIDGALRRVRVLRRCEDASAESLRPVSAE